MPYYNWKGIDWYGQIYSGKNFARSEPDLIDYLLTQEIGLIRCDQIKHKSLFNRIYLSTIVKFFKELAVLIDSGVLLPIALQVVRQQTTSNSFKNVIEEIEFEVQEGKSFSNTLINYPYVFDYLIVQIIKAGEESGNLGNSLIALSNYLEKKEKFNQRLRSALMLPIITFSLFIFISLIIFLFIIPSFSSIFSYSDQEIPKATQRLIKFSQFLRNYGLLYILIFIVILIAIINRILKFNKIKSSVNKTVLQFPFIGSLIKFSTLTYFLHSLSLLLAGGIHLVDSLQIIILSIRNEYFKNIFSKLCDDIKEGKTFSQAMKENKNDIFFPNLIAMVNVAEETGNLANMLDKASIFYFEKSDRLIGFFLTAIQPALMIILGLFIALLIFAVYIPIFNLSNIVKY